MADDKPVLCATCARPIASYGQTRAFLRGEGDDAICHGSSDPHCSRESIAALRRENDRLRQQLREAESAALRRAAEECDAVAKTYRPYPVRREMAAMCRDRILSLAPTPGGLEERRAEVEGLVECVRDARTDRGTIQHRPLPPRGDGDE